MRKLNEEEAKLIITKPIGRVSRFRVEAINLKVGEYLLIEKKEWDWKSATPSVMCRRVEKRSALRFDCKRMLDDTGWLIKRIK
ncbi:MAG: hypothetical protein ABIT08_08360 [Bacteroidia bacterium]